MNAYTTVVDRLPPSLPAVTRPWQRTAARVLLVGWAGFWTWFVTSLAVSEWPAAEPLIALGVLWTVALVAWFLPRAGAGVLLVFAAWSGWLFAGGSAVWMVAAPACVIALLNWLGAARLNRAATAGSGCA